MVPASIHKDGFKTSLPFILSLHMSYVSSLMLAPDEGTTQLRQQWSMWASTSALPLYNPLI